MKKNLKQHNRNFRKRRITPTLEAQLLEQWRAKLEETSKIWSSLVEEIMFIFPEIPGIHKQKII